LGGAIAAKVFSPAHDLVDGAISRFPGFVRLATFEGTTIVPSQVALETNLETDEIAPSNEITVLG